MDYNKLSKAAHDNAVKHGFWEEKLSEEHSLMLIVSEVSEAMEAYRKSNWCKEKNESRFEEKIKDTVQDELADIMIRLFDLAGNLDLDFKKMQPCRYFRRYGNFSFVENSFGLVKGLCKGYIAIEKRILFGLDYVEKWCKSLNIDIEFHVNAKMNYNKSRPYKHNKLC